LDTTGQLVAKGQVLVIQVLVLHSLLKEVVVLLSLLGIVVVHHSLLEEVLVHHSLLEEVLVFHSLEEEQLQKGSHALHLLLLVAKDIALSYLLTAM